MKVASIVSLIGVLAVTGCISTQEMPLAPNMVRIDTQAQGLLFTGQTVPQTMRAAATATLNRGFTHFKFADASMNQGSQAVGIVSSGNGNFSGSCFGAYCSGSSNGFSSASVVHAPTSSAAATVIMFKASDPEAKNAFDAEAILKQYAN